MEKLKDPAMLLSVSNSIGLIGTTAYFYKQIESIRIDMVKMSQTLTGVLRKISEIEKGDQHKSEALHTLNDQIKHINDQINELPSLGEFNNIDIDLSEIVDVLENNNIFIDRPSQSLRPRRSGDRRSQARRPQNEQEVDDRREAARRSSVRSSDRTRSDTSKDFDSQYRRETTHEQGREQPREYTREQIREPIREPRGGRQEQSGGYEDDLDLIGEVRRQQQTRT